MEVRNATGYLASRIVFYLMNLHTKRRTIYFARAGHSATTAYKSDDGLSPDGQRYAQLLADKLFSFREEEHAKDVEKGEKSRSLTVIFLSGLFLMYNRFGRLLVCVVCKRQGGFLVI
jgi:6-phosphofructo-2-kinase / fructose-2,6-biphosphatase 4